MSKVFARMLRPEDRLHSNVCDYILYKYPGAVIHHSPNEGKRTAFERYLIKVLHVSAGFPDLLVFYKGKIIAIELKAGKNIMTPNQRKWVALLDAYFPTRCCVGFDDAARFIDEQLGGK